MKKRQILYVLLVSLLLTGCGGDTASDEQSIDAELPYLTVEERTAIEQPILDSMQLTADHYSSDYYNLLVSFSNDSDYYLYDFQLRIAGENSSLFSLTAVPPHTDVSIKNSWGQTTPMERAKETKNCYDLRYTIGEFLYERTDIKIPMTEKSSIDEENTAPPIRFLIETENGEVELKQDGQTVFGEENPLACKAIRADYAEFREKMEYYANSGYYYSNSVYLYGELQEGKAAYYHLIDEEGMVRATDRVYFYSSDHYCYIWLPNALTPGTYTIRFVEAEK